MFDGIKRAMFIAKSAAKYAEIYCREIAKDHLEMQQRGFPANEFVDLYRAAKCPEYDFPQFMNNLLHFSRLGERKEYFARWAEQSNVKAADKLGLTNMFR